MIKNTESFDSESEIGIDRDCVDITMTDENLKLEAEYRNTDDEITEKSREVFGISYLFPWQRLVIANILDAFFGEEDRKLLGKQIVLLPTGAGKSLCFQIPALFLDGATLVIYPLLALMSDQQRRIDAGGLGSVIFRGGQTGEDRAKNFTRIKNGDAKIIIANPEVLQDERLISELHACKISHIAIDEAHCVSEWGDTFRPSYLSLGEIIKKLGSPVVTAFTATASPLVLSRISEILFDGDAHIVRSASDRPNIHYHVQYTASKHEAAIMLAQTERRPMIIFCGTRARAEDMSRSLVACYGKDFSRFYHAGLERAEKTEIENWFFNAEDAVLCATCAYGMGVDKSNIRTVVHLDPANSVEAYVQEAGRAGRNGDVAKAILLWSAEDSIKFAEYGDASRASVIKKFAEADSCRRQILLEALGAEEASTVVCEGCDICDGTTKIFPDFKLAYEFIRAHRKHYNRAETENILVNLLNQKIPLLHDGKKLRIWTDTAIVAIVEQLIKTGIVMVKKNLWQNKLDALSIKKLLQSENIIPRLFLLPHHHLNHLPIRLALAKRQRQRVLAFWRLAKVFSYSARRKKQKRYIKKQK